MPTKIEAAVVMAGSRMTRSLPRPARTTMEVKSPLAVVDDAPLEILTPHADGCTMMVSARLLPVIWSWLPPFTQTEATPSGLAASSWRGSSASSKLCDGLLRGLIDLSSSLASGEIEYGRGRCKRNYPALNPCFYSGLRRDYSAIEAVGLVNVGGAWLVGPGNPTW